MVLKPKNNAAYGLTAIRQGSRAVSINAGRSLRGEKVTTTRLAGESQLNGEIQVVDAYMEKYQARYEEVAHQNISPRFTNWHGAPGLKANH